VDTIVTIDTTVTLAAPCPAIERPAADDFDAWQASAIEVLRQYAE